MNFEIIFILKRLTNEVTVKNYKDSKLQHKIESQLSEAIKKINSYSDQNILNENNSNIILSECKNLSSALQNFFKSFGDLNVKKKVFFLFFHTN